MIFVLTHGEHNVVVFLLYFNSGFLLNLCLCPFYFTAWILQNERLFVSESRFIDGGPAKKNLR